MQIGREIIYLFRKEVTLEWRQKYAISGILLYVLSTVYVVYISALEVEKGVWNTLFWIMILFASVNAVVKSFQQESGHRQLYYYTLANPIAILVSKVLYNFLLLLVLSVLTYATYSLITGNPVLHPLPFWLAIVLGALGFSITFTFVSAIAAKASNSATMMAILSFPLIIPIIATLISLAKSSLISWEVVQPNIWQDVYLLVAIDLLLLGAAFGLFPFLWRD
jgi:heme exporter protein B